MRSLRTKLAMSGFVSRVLCRDRQANSTTIIYLCTTIARRLNCDLPECDHETDRLACLTRGVRQLHSVWSSSGWGLPSRSSHPDRWCALTAPFHPCHASAAIRQGDSREPFGGLLSDALSLTSRPVDVIDHPVLRSPDFPPVITWVTSDRPTHS